MKHVPYRDIDLKDIEMDGCKGVKMRMLVGEDDGAPNFFMRRFDLEPAGYTPKHTHDWEHETYILEGDGTVFGNGEEKPMKAGDVIYVPPNEEHQFIASADGPLAFICLIPKK